MSAFTVEAEIILHPDIDADPAKLAALQSRLADMSPVMTEIGDILQDQLRENFDSQGGGTWPPLAASTWRRKKTDQMLVETGRLHDALTIKGAEGNKFLVSPDSVIVGVYGDVVPYAAYINSGTARMPARMIINVTDVDRVVNALRDFLTGGDPELAQYVEVLQDVALDSMSAPEVDFSVHVQQVAATENGVLEPWGDTLARFGGYAQDIKDAFGNVGAAVKNLWNRFWN